MKLHERWLHAALQIYEATSMIRHERGRSPARGGIVETESYSLQISVSRPRQWANLVDRCLSSPSEDFATRNQRSRNLRSGPCAGIRWSSRPLKGASGRHCESGAPRVRTLGSFNFAPRRSAAVPRSPSAAPTPSLEPLARIFTAPESSFGARGAGLGAAKGLHLPEALGLLSLELSPETSESMSRTSNRADYKPKASTNSFHAPEHTIQILKSSAWRPRSERSFAVSFSQDMFCYSLELAVDSAQPVSSNPC